MIIALRTDKPESEIYLYDSSGKLLHKDTWQAHRKLAETIHHQIAKSSQFVSKKLEDIEGIIVFEGPGSFTGLRIGVSVANALAYSLEAPVVGTSGHSWVQDGLALLKSKKSPKYALPKYDSPAHTTTPKK